VTSEDNSMYFLTLFPLWPTARLSLSRSQSLSVIYGLKIVNLVSSYPMPEA